MRSLARPVPSQIHQPGRLQQRPQQGAGLIRIVDQRAFGHGQDKALRLFQKTEAMHRRRRQANGRRSAQRIFPVVDARLDFAVQQAKQLEQAAMTMVDDFPVEAAAARAEQLEMQKRRVCDAALFAIQGEFRRAVHAALPNQD